MSNGLERRRSEAKRNKSFRVPSNGLKLMYQATKYNFLAANIQSERKVPVHLLESRLYECTYGYIKC